MSQSMHQCGGLADLARSLERVRSGSEGGLGIRLDVEEWGYERDRKLDLLGTQRGCAGQGRDLAEGAGELGCRLHERRARQRSLPPLAPQTRRFLDQPGLGAMMRQQLGLA